MIMIIRFVHLLNCDYAQAQPQVEVKSYNAKSNFNYQAKLKILSYNTMNPMTMNLWMIMIRTKYV